MVRWGFLCQFFFHNHNNKNQQLKLKYTGNCLVRKIVYKHNVLLHEPFRRQQPDIRSVVRLKCISMLVGLLTRSRQVSPEAVTRVVLPPTVTGIEQAGMAHGDVVTLRRHGPHCRPIFRL